jgi:hypothetical protein
MFRRFTIVLLLLSTTGCIFGRHGNDGANITPADQDPDRAAHVAAPVGSAADFDDTRPLDPPPVDAVAEAQVKTRLDVYSLTVPAGVVSLDDAFWKRVDETAVAPDAYDVLFKNGVRVGTAPTAEWEFFRGLIAKHPTVTQQGDFAGDDGKAIEMAVQKGIDQQTIFVLDSGNRLVGRSFDRCENLLSLTFHPLARQPGTVRVAMVPLVRSLRTRMEFNTQNAVGTELQYVSPEYFYNLNLRAEIPTGRFLIVAPSREGRWPTSVGSVFFTSGGAGERHERVLLMVPKLVTLTPVRR